MIFSETKEGMGRFVASVDWSRSEIGDDRGKQFAYIFSYKLCADDLLNQMICKNYSDIILETTLDIYVYAICFMYRHYLELLMKKIFFDINGSQFNQSRQNHDLVGLFCSIECHLADNEKDTLRGIVDEIDHYDNKSFSFRYPKQRDCEGAGVYLENELFIDLQEFKNRIDEVDSLLWEKYIPN